MQEKSENLTASDQYFLSYIKKLQGGGQIDPPPAGIGLKDKYKFKQKMESLGFSQNHGRDE